MQSPITHPEERLFRLSTISFKVLFRLGGIGELDTVIHRIAYFPKFRIGFGCFKDKRVAVIPFTVFLEITVFLRANNAYRRTRTMSLQGH